MIFNGEKDISGIQQDSWYNKEMEAGSHGSIRMDCSVFFVNFDNIEGMEMGAVAMAGELLSSEAEPIVVKEALFNHDYDFNWDRRLQGNNIDRIIAREMRLALELGGEDEQTFDEMAKGWNEENWDDFAEDVTAHDPSNTISVNDLKLRIL